MSGFFFHQTPRLIQSVFPTFTWRKSGNQKIIYLTFDDGPVPEATTVVLECLRSYKAHATFFCVGENITKHPELFRQVLNEGHSLGNHTYHHLNGWQTATATFLNDVMECDHCMQDHGSTYVQPLMRPPYGRLKRSQWQALSKTHDIVMWDVLSGDFSNRISSEKCLQKSIQFTKNGSIVLFHDSIKTVQKLKSVLPRYLDHFSKLRYSFQGL